jgi:hypothetical protein
MTETISNTCCIIKPRNPKWPQTLGHLTMSQIACHLYIRTRDFGAILGSGTRWSFTHACPNQSHGQGPITRPGSNRTARVQSHGQGPIARPGSNRMARVQSHGQGPIARPGSNRTARVQSHGPELLATHDVSDCLSSLDGTPGQKEARLRPFRKENILTARFRPFNK